MKIDTQKRNKSDVKKREREKEGKPAKMVHIQHSHGLSLICCELTGNPLVQPIRFKWVKLVFLELNKISSIKSSFFCSFTNQEGGQRDFSSSFIVASII